ncbi:hypothetical protein [Streptomyces sp. NPDC029674]|uniref:hypothetical protein n=1 Tax=Streptomyces sp. NPDC029674 TaxID=3365297 RepID=UPI00385126E6
MLDLIVERVTGRDLRSNLECRIFAPPSGCATPRTRWHRPPSTEPMYTATRTSRSCCRTHRAQPGSASARSSSDTIHGCH